MHIAHGRANVTMAQEALHGGQVHASLDQVSGESVAQAVDAAFGGDAGGVARSAVDALRRLDLYRRAALAVGKEPLARPPIAPVAAQHVEQSRREQRVAILSALALAHLEAHAIGGALDVGQLQGANFGHA